MVIKSPIPKPNPAGKFLVIIVGMVVGIAKLSVQVPDKLALLGMVKPVPITIVLSVGCELGIAIEVTEVLDGEEPVTS